ncbi:MAG: Subtilisin-like serine protease [Candidatus Methanogaster sp.]|nr:MAG: Subtilisin-like serine protease [ANME-2 cluster archaeon]
MKRNNLIFVFHIVVVALVCVSGITSTVGATVTDPLDLWTSEDIVQLDAVVREGVLTVQVSERNPLNDLNYIEIFLDTDQNHTTGDTRIGGVGGTDYRISCLTGMLNMYNLHRLPTEDGGVEQITNFSNISGASASVFGNTLTVKLPVNVLGGTTAVDVFAVAHIGDRPDQIIGNGDRCPEAGSLDTSTGEVVVRQSGVPLDVTFNDPEDDNQNGQDLTSARFRTFGDQFQIILTFADPIDLSDYFYELSGAVILDSDRDLLTGFRGMGDKIPTWGGDIELLYTVNRMTPTFLLRYGHCKGCFLFFGPHDSDGRWLVWGNQLIITGSLSVFDARAFAGIVDDGVEEVERRTTDGQMIATVHTSDYAKMADIMPEGGRTFDTGTGQVLEPLVWDPDVTISKTDPEEFGEVSGMDLIQVDVEVVDSHLVVKGDLSRWDATQRDNLFEILLDTDMNTATGEPVYNDLTPGQPTIGADYKARVYGRDEYTHIGYYAALLRLVDRVIEPHDAILFAQPSSLRPASFTVTIPLEGLDNPTSELRLFVTSGRTSGYDVAPAYPITVNLVENKLPVASFSYTPESPLVNQMITFDASASYAPDGNITNYEWNFGDETNGTGGMINYSYSSAGKYDVTLTVTDDVGAADTMTKQVEVIASEPDFTIGVSSSSQTVVAGNSTFYNITLATRSGFESPVTLSVTGLPDGANGTFDPNPVTPAGLTLRSSMGRKVDASKIDSALALLSSLKSRKQPVSYKAMTETSEEDCAEVSIRFTHELNNSEIQSIEDMGVRFTRIDTEIAHVGAIYGAKVPWDMTGDLANLPEVVLIESTLRPKVVPPLEISVPEIGADQVWRMTDNRGMAITGKGITIANFDTGIDVFHPDFFRADGGAYGWIDTNSNDVFDTGTDAVDLNRNGVADPTENLKFIDATSDVSTYIPVTGTNDGVFRADIDWLYNDANNNGKRDYGIANGFTETDPTYGERLFIVNDANHNNGLDTGEILIALGTSKIYKTLNWNGVTRTRGVDLIQTQPDIMGHGTSVCGILSGGITGRRCVGVAPDADLLVADSYNNPYTTYIPWAERNGADVMLYEFGWWTSKFLDGSSNIEQMIDIEAGAGIAQIIPAGNLADKRVHITTTVGEDGSSNINFNIPSWQGITSVNQTVLWRNTSNNLAFQIITPCGSTVNLPGDKTWVPTGDEHYVWSCRKNSDRGTAKFDIHITKWGGYDYAPISAGAWGLNVTNAGASEEIDGYIVDDVSRGHGFGATFLNFVNNSRTVTWPATADSAITVASYSTRGFFGVAAGDLSTFSSRGPRIDGQHIIDIAAPGNYDIGSAMSKDQGTEVIGKYWWFSGTSAASPHVAAAAALMLQARPGLTHNQLKKILRDTAREDTFTGSTPNENWGYGKLDVLSAVNPLTPSTDNTSTLKIVTSASTPPGNYALTITGTVGEKTQDIQATLHVTTALRGDVNHDGAITSADAAIALGMVAHGEWNADADISGDGQVTSLDALMILQVAAGRISL